MLIDISQELFSCRVYPGDPAPASTALTRMEAGDVCNTSAISLCAHNGTHVDAPWHFIRDGKTIDRVGLVPFVGPCYVARHTGEVTGADAEDLLRRAREAGAGERLLIAGPATVTEEAAEVLAAARLLLVGNESQTVGPENAPARVHRLLLGAGTVLLEGVVLTDVAEGAYTLHAAPLNLAGLDGTPCRAYLTD